MFESILASEQANKAAVLLANERFNAQLAPFVKGSATRLDHVRPELERIISEVCSETGADVDYVTSRLDDHLSKAILDKDHAKREKLKVKTTPLKNQKEVPLTGDIKHTDFDDEGEVAGAGYDEARTPDAKDDLNKYKQKGVFPVEHKKGCFRCGEELHEKVAAVTSVCDKCTKELVESTKKGACEDCGCGDSSCDCDPENCDCEKKSSVKEADIYNPIGPVQTDLAQQTVKPVQEDLPFQCTICGRQGTQEEVLAHVNTDHRDVLEQQRQQYVQNPGATVPLSSTKEGAPADIEEQAIVEPLPEAPGDSFDDMVQDLANRAAAIQFSTLEEKDLHALAESLGLGPDDLNGQVQVVAVFDNYTGLNGELVNEVPEMPADYQEVQSSAIRATAHEALVPTQIVINKVAEQMNMPADLAYNMVRDKYGAELPDKYHAAVQGEYHFYVPAALAVNTEDKATEQGDIGPTALAPDGGQPQPVQPVR